MLCWNLKLIVQQFDVDVKATFSHSFFKEGKEEYVCNLTRSLYALKQSAISCNDASGRTIVDIWFHSQWFEHIHVFVPANMWMTMPSTVFRNWKESKFWYFGHRIHWPTITWSSWQKDCRNFKICSYRMLIGSQPVDWKGYSHMPSNCRI